MSMVMSLRLKKGRHFNCHNQLYHFTVLDLLAMRNSQSSFLYYAWHTKTRKHRSPSHWLSMHTSLYICNSIAMTINLLPNEGPHLNCYNTRSRAKHLACSPLIRNRYSNNLLTCERDPWGSNEFARSFIKFYRSTWHALSDTWRGTKKSQLSFAL